MNIKTTIALLLILAGIGVYFLVIEKNRTVTPGTESKQSTNVFSAQQLFPDGISKVTITKPLEKAVITRDADGNWMQVDPVRFPLSTLKMHNGLSYTAATLKFSDRFKPGQDGKPTLSQMQLDQPVATITFEGEFRDAQLVEGGSNAKVTVTPFSTTIKLGSVITGSRGYIQVNDDPTVYVVSDTLHQILKMQSVASWRETSLQAPDDAQARRIEVLIDGEMVKLEKKEGDWRLAPPHAGRIATAAARTLLAAVRQLSIARFVDDEADLARYGLDKPEVVITVQGTGPHAEPRTLRIGNAADINEHTFHATWSVGDKPSRVVFTVLKQAKAYLAPRLSDLRDPRVTPIDQATFVTELAIRRPGDPPIHLQKETSKGWSFVVAPPPAVTPDFKPDQELVNALIEVFTAATASYIIPIERPSTAPLATVELFSKSPRIEDTLSLFEPPKDAVPAGEEVPMLLVMRSNKQTGEEGVGYLVPRAKLEPALRPVVALRDRQVLTLTEREVRGIAIQRYDGAAYEFVHTTDGAQTWTLEGAETFEWESLRNLFIHLMNLKVERWLDGPAEIGQKRIVLGVRINDDPAKFLTVDPATRHATLTGEPKAFMVTPETVALLELEYRDRSVLPEAAGNIAQVTVPMPDGKRKTIGRDELNQFHVLNPDGTPIATQRVNPRDAALLFSGLGPLRVERYIDPLPVDWKNDAQKIIEVTTKTRIKYTLYLGFPGHENVGLLNGRWFTLSGETLGKITGTASKEK